MNANKKAYFDNHPKTNELHFTTDGFAFFEKHHAHSHANHLQDKTVATHTRAEAEAWAKAQEGGKQPEQTKKEETPIKHKVTAEDLLNNPELAAQGVQEGDEIELGELVVPATKENLKAATKKTAKKAAEPKPAAAKKAAGKKAATK